MSLNQKIYYYRIGVFYGKYRLSVFIDPVTSEGLEKPRFVFDEFGRILILSSDLKGDKSAILLKRVEKDFLNILENLFSIEQKNIIEK